MSDVRALEFDFYTVGHERDGAPRASKIVRLSNGRTLVIDDAGVYDFDDADLDAGTTKPGFGWLSWDELLERLDTERGMARN